MANKFMVSICGNNLNKVKREIQYSTLRFRIQYNVIVKSIETLFIFIGK